jgi:hypothetical protein
MLLLVRLSHGTDDRSVLELCGLLRLSLAENPDASQKRRRVTARSGAHLVHVNLMPSAILCCRASGSWNSSGFVPAL